MQCKQPYRQYRQALTKQADRQQTAIKSGQRHSDRQTRTRATDRQTEINVDGTEATERGRTGTGQRDEIHDKTERDGDRQTDRDRDMASKTGHDRRSGSQPAANDPARQAARPTSSRACLKSRREATNQTSLQPGRHESQANMQAEQRTTQACMPTGRHTVDMRKATRARR